MANRTVKDAKSIRGTNPQYLVEKIIRSRIYDSKYWKEECFALTAELLVDKAMELRYLGGVHGGFIYPTPFLCLLLKMLQIQPEKDIVVEFIKNEEFKYVRALGAFYMRLTGTSLDCYKYLEPLYNDNRKLRRQNRDGQFELVHMDEYIDELLREERLCDVILPRIQKRHILEENNELEPKVSALDDDLDEDVPSDEEIVDTETKENKREKDRRDRDRRRDRSRDRERRDKDRKRERSRSRERDRRWDRERERERERDRERIRDRERDREKERRERHEVDRRRDRGRY
ncbi:pre-mRNA-splicing factor 38 [Vanessa tameamea]|uniref:Pre-mRNA-splicing factor 38 n=1 Tax=Vanessa tameamea TaxID=334116 RepID=A0A8B8IPM1_VANTA|nr:pre-mRNA-splicing factor 38-like [Vanessa tameamea]XP_047539343.1 pre-mRNA-splicing factor 38 [Vanessa atalanta]